MPPAMGGIVKNVGRLVSVLGMLFLLIMSAASSVSAGNAQVSAADAGPLTISTSDGGDIPAGTQITIFGGVNYPIGVAYGETLAAAQSSPYTVSGFMGDSGYVYQAYASGAAGYADANSDVFQGGTAANVELQLITYTVTLNVTTEDGGDIPAGTAYSFKDSNNNVVLSGTVPANMTCPWQPTITDVAPGDYTLTISGATGYQDLIQSATVSAEATTFNVELLLVPTPTATLTPTATATASATLVPTDTATAVPTATSTAIPTDTATAVPTDTATTEPTNTAIPATSTAVPSVTSVPTSTAETTGAAAVTLTTSDGGDVPDNTQVCVGDVCQTVGAGASAAAVSPTTLTFADLAPGTYPVMVTNDAPYADAASTVTVTAGETAQITITLEAVAAPTTIATEPGNATPVTTVTVVPTQGTGGGVVVPTNAPSSGGVVPSKRNASAGGTTVKALPNTGAGQESSSTSLVMLLLATLAVGVTGTFAWRRRTR
jgi:LPXTG-motif cell wall-anchored protein